MGDYLAEWERDWESRSSWNPEKVRAAWRLREQGWSYAEIASHFGTTVADAYSLVQVAARAGTPEDPAADSQPEPPDVADNPQMYTAHRIDELAGHLSHATERMAAARRAHGRARVYEGEHILVDLQQAQLAGRRLTANVRQHYPHESAEMDRIVSLTDGGLKRAVSLSPVHKAMTFAHLLQTSMYDIGHALRHSQAMDGETGKPEMWNFDADHCAKHLGGALEHVRKLSKHVIDNYPAESKWLKTLSTLERPGS